MIEYKRTNPEQRLQSVQNRLYNLEMQHWEASLNLIDSPKAQLQERQQTVEQLEEMINDFRRVESEVQSEIDAQRTDQDGPTE